MHAGQIKDEGCYFLLERSSGEIEEGPDTLQQIVWELESKAEAAAEYKEPFNIDDWLIIGPTYTPQMDVSVKIGLKPILHKVTQKQ